MNYDPYTVVICMKDRRVGTLIYYALVVMPPIRMNANHYHIYMHLLMRLFPRASSGDTSEQRLSERMESGSERFLAKKHFIFASKNPFKNEVLGNLAFHRPVMLY